MIGEEDFIARATDDRILLLHLWLLNVGFSLTLLKGIFVLCRNNTWLIMLWVRIVILVSSSWLRRHGMLIVWSEVLGSVVNS